MISEEAAKILLDLSLRPEPESYYERFDADLSDYSNALAKMRQLAKKDLKVR